MRPSAPSPASFTTRLVLLCALSVLTACQSLPVQPVPPEPPHIACAEHAPAADVPPLPSPLTMDAQTLLIAELYGVIGIEDGKRATTADCLDAYRKRGVIR